MKIGLLLICPKKEVAVQLMKKVDDNLLKLFKTVFETPVQAGFKGAVCSVLRKTALLLLFA